MYSVHSTLLHRLATASKPTHFNLWQWHERDSHYSMQESSRTTVCVKCVTEQYCGLLTLHSLRGTWTNEWMGIENWWKDTEEKTWSTGRTTCPNTTLPPQIHTDWPGTRPMQGSDMLTTINPTHSTAPSGTRINFGTLHSKVSNNRT